MSLLVNPSALDRFSDNPALIRQIVQLYIETSEQTEQKIHKNVAIGDTEQVAWHTHTLKGSSTEVGAEQLVELCQQLQVTAKAGDLIAIAPLADSLARCYQETVKALKARDNSV